MSRFAAIEGNDGEQKKPDKQPDKYSGVVNFDMELTPSVWICGAAGTVLRVILAMWGFPSSSRQLF
jgi:hypothetical protein